MAGLLSFNANPPVLLIDCLVFSNRVAGPIYRLRKLCGSLRTAVPRRRCGSGGRLVAGFGRRVQSRHERLVACQNRNAELEARLAEMQTVDAESETAGIVYRSVRVAYCQVGHRDVFPLHFAGRREMTALGCLLERQPSDLLVNLASKVDSLPDERSRSHVFGIGTGFREQMGQQATHQPACQASGSAGLTARGRCRKCEQSVEAAMSSSDEVGALVSSCRPERNSPADWHRK